MGSAGIAGQDRFLALTDSERFRREWARLVGMRGGSLAECRSLAEARRAVRVEQIALVIVDAAYCPVAEALRDPALSLLCKATHVLLADVPSSVDEELAALAAGVSGCCAANLGAEELGTVIDVVLKGGIWVSRPTLPLLLSRLQGAAAAGQRSAPAERTEADRLAGAWATLTKREKEIAVQVAAGDSNKIIAGHFDISDATIKAHLTSIYHKLGVSSRLQLALLLSGVAGHGGEAGEGPAPENSAASSGR